MGKSTVVTGDGDKKFVLRIGNQLKTRKSMKTKDSKIRKNVVKSKKAESEWEVESIVDKKEVDGSVQYLVKWVGYSEDENTWEPPEHLAGCPNLIEEFEARNGANTSIKSEVLEETSSLEEDAPTMTRIISGFDLEPESILSVSRNPESAELLYVVKCKRTKKLLEVPSSVLQEAHHELLISYLHSIIQWCPDARTHKNECNDGEV